MSKKTLTTIKIFTLAIVFTVGISFAYASWSAPNFPPPYGNIPQPIHEGSETQTINGVFTASGGIVVGQSSVVCNPSNAGVIRWNTDTDPSSVVTPSLQSCNGAIWKLLPQPNNDCEIRQETRQCTEMSTYECNCGKEGCQTCTATVTGIQYQALFFCEAGGVDVRTGWSNCQ